jgi:hypothetical protein
MTLFEDNGAVNYAGREALLSVVDPVIVSLFKDLADKGYHPSEAFTLIVLSAGDARVDSVLDLMETSNDN